MVVDEGEDEENNKRGSNFDELDLITKEQQQIRSSIPLKMLIINLKGHNSDTRIPP